jgi:Pvc16 N-terminal domain
MIYEALKCVSDSLNVYLRTRFALSKDKVSLSPVVDKDGNSGQIDRDKIAITLINVEQEKHVQKGDIRAGMRPPMHLNLYVLFTVYFGEDSSYEESLRELSAIISFFQANTVLNHQNTPDLDDRIDRLVFEYTNQDMQSMNYIWGMLGGKFAPSVLYKVRMVTIQEGIVDSIIPKFTGFGKG